jgi:oxaloacetate decarboxylase alpha subunit|tara:strand:- start:1106 stop:2464 length:1359 start_codon:yes stop_codon:yes gene_type:complete
MLKNVGLTEVVLRDGNQSLLSTRLKLEDLIPIASKLDDIGYSSIESWGGAIFDSCVRYLNEDPWERLRELKKAMPKTKQQMLLRGQNLVGYKHYSDEIVFKFIEKSSENGIDIFRIFDALNDLRNIKQSVKVVQDSGKHAQGTLAYTISPIHTLDNWIDLAKQIEDLGCDSLCIKDMSGILSPEYAFNLISELKKMIQIPIHLHTHATTGMSNLTNLRAIDAGVDNIDTSISSMSMGYGHSATETMVYLMEEKGISTKINLEDLIPISDYFKNIREKYEEFEGSMKGVDIQMLVNQVPGGMLSNLETQLKGLGKVNLLEDVVSEIYNVRKDLGFVPLVTPASQIIGAQALSNIINKKYETLSVEIIDLALGYYGKLPGELDKSLLEKAEKNKKRITQRPADLLSEKFTDYQNDLSIFCKKLEINDLSSSEENVLTFILIPYGSEKLFKSLNS